MSWRERKCRILRPVVIPSFVLLLLSAPVGIAFAQVPARVEPPYTLIDDESRFFVEGGFEAPLKGNGPLTGCGYLFYTKPHFVDQDLYLRLVIPPGYFISELVKDHDPATVTRYLEGRFGHALPAVRTAMAKLARSFPPKENDWDGTTKQGDRQGLAHLELPPLFAHGFQPPGGSSGGRRPYRSVAAWSLWRAVEPAQRRRLQPKVT